MKNNTLVAWSWYTANYDINKKILYALTYDNRNLYSPKWGPESVEKWDELF